jgi:hypothetical protein
MNLNMLGQTFEVSAPYEPGHQVNEAEARTLNQTRLENLSNNLRAKLKAVRDEGAAEGTEGEWSPEKIAKAAEMVKELDGSYAFGMGRTGGGAAVSRDPLTSECRRIATDYLAAKLKEKGTTLAAQRKADKDGIEAKIAEFSQHPKVRAQAEKVLKARKGLGDISFDEPSGEEAAA